MSTVLFVCTANRVRSPFAEAVARTVATERTLQVQVSSAGFMSSGHPAVTDMAQVAREAGYDLSGHTSRQLDASLLDQSDVIVAMTGAHVVDLVGVDPSAKRRILTLSEAAAAAETHPVDSWDAESLREWATGPTARSIDELLSGRWDIVDPIGGPLRGYRRAASEIERCVWTLLDATAPTARR